MCWSNWSWNSHWLMTIPPCSTLRKRCLEFEVLSPFAKTCHGLRRMRRAPWKASCQLQWAGACLACPPAPQRCWRQSLASSSSARISWLGMGLFSTSFQTQLNPKSRCQPRGRGSCSCTGKGQMTINTFRMRKFIQNEEFSAKTDKLFSFFTGCYILDTGVRLVPQTWWSPLL